MKSTGAIFLILTISHANLIQGRALVETVDGVAANGIIKDIQLEQVIYRLKQRQPKQDEDSAPARPAGGTNGLIAATPIGQIIQNVVPNAQEAVVSILKGVTSPFDFITKYVDNYINPTTTAAPPVPQQTRIISVNSGYSGGGGYRGNGNNGGGITLVLLPASEPQHPVQPVTAAPAVAASVKPTSSTDDEEEENEENGENGENGDNKD